LKIKKKIFLNLYDIKNGNSSSVIDTNESNKSNFIISPISPPNRFFLSFSKNSSHLRIQSQPALGDNAKTSCLFRFKDAMTYIYDQHLAPLLEEDQIPAVLIVGVANGEEPLSWLSLFHCGTAKPLSESVQLSTIDIQNREEIVMQRALGSVPLGQNPISPDARVFNAFSFDIETRQYQVNDQIVRHLEDVFNSINSKWGASILDSRSMTVGQEYDLVTCNCVLSYIPHHFRAMALKNLMDSVKLGGVLMIDPLASVQMGINVDDKEEIMATRLFEELRPGVFKKISSN
jgi:chemotaxis methyl-accepting protein methylase